MANQYQYLPLTYSQSIFPQPQGNVYMINNSLEVANVPMGIGISVALCLQEGLCYLKTIQNGTPVFKTYKIIPQDQEKTPEDSNEINELLKSFDERLRALENKKGGRLDELL